ncbi:helix-turn-helix domain-containing protein [Tsuneonella sp. SYSU-LHT278]|uniref:helix-turn-helix domain-containing protein n=1 Tax=Tsuneonella sediminis TaxID=3416089 RepID=UPI003F796966
MPDQTVSAPPLECTVSARFFAPPEGLEGCLTSIYRLELSVAGPGVVTDWLQPEWANLRVFSGARPWAQVGEGRVVDDARFTVTGPSSRGTRFELGTTRMWGIGLLPLGWARLVGRPAAGYANMLADAERHPDFARFADLPGIFAGTPDDDIELERIIAVLRRASRPLADETRIVAVHQAMIQLGLAKVDDFAQRAGLSVRALERVCRRHFGFPPKLLLRRQRFVRSIAAWMLGGMGKWTGAIDELYTDQAHFNHEFHEFMGMSPSEYAALPHPILAEFMEQRAKSWGSPAQTLDRPPG